VLFMRTAVCILVAHTMQGRRTTMVMEIICRQNHNENNGNLSSSGSLKMGLISDDL